MTPLRFVFGIHVHQPVGNFDHVFEEHTREVYLPLLERLVEREFFPIVMHVSGPLLEWLDSSHAHYLDLVGELASAGKIEMLLSGYYEPILAALPREDRVEQITWMKDMIKSRFGVTSTGLWLTERVWEPEIAADLANAGVRYVLVDDRHFLVTGFNRDQLHKPWRTESDGKCVDVLAIDERLRYLIPFRPPSEIATYVRELNEAGHELAVFADDGEKFGGWPGTREWVYEKGWLKDFLDTMEQLVDSNELILSTGSAALAAVKPGGLAYLPTASYREMEGWSLPAEAAVRLSALEKDLGPEKFEKESAFIRGAHWRNFLAKYPESNRAHKKMMHLSRLCRSRGDPVIARRAIGRAQCNDASWHGVFGGLYLPHLREAVWSNLAVAEQHLRRDEELAVEVLDFDADGNDEVWFHSSHFSAVVSPAMGGAIVEYTMFGDRINYADVLTRRFEAYHQVSAPEAAHDDDSDGIASIHHLEESMKLTEAPPIDEFDRAISVDSKRADRSFEIQGSVLLLRGEGVEKRMEFSDEGNVTISWKWEPGAADFATEISLLRPMDLQPVPAAKRSTMLVETVAKSERGLDRTIQGEAITLRWPGSAGGAELRILKY